MASNPCPSFGSMPCGIFTKCFSHLSYSNLCQIQPVCKTWYHLIWKSIDQSLNPTAAPPFYSKEEAKDIKTGVLKDLENWVKSVDKILNFINTDVELFSVINNESNSLARLRNMVPIERTWNVMRGLRQSCSELCMHLIKRYQNEIKGAQERLDSTYFWEWPSVDNMVCSEAYETEENLPLLVDLIKNPPGPFDASEILLATLPIILSPYAQKKGTDIWAAVVQTHPDLSKFLSTEIDSALIKTDLKSQPADEAEKISIKELLINTIIPLMTKFQFQITADDWKQCGISLTD